MERRNIEICPYWRRWAIRGTHILVLCGTKSPDEKLLSDTDLGYRQAVCPLFSDFAGQAFRTPQIREQELYEDGSWGIPSMIITAPSGEIGVNRLERIWNREVREFVKRHP